jgi:hypothetical protein
MMIDFAPGVDWTAMIAVIMAVQQVRKQSMPDGPVLWVRIPVQPPAAGHKKQLELTDLCGWFRSPNQQRKDWVQ